MSDTNTDITGIDKVLLIKEIWRRSKCLNNSMFSYSPELTEKDIQHALKAHYVDILAGKLFRTYFTSNKLETYGYNRDHFPGAMQAIVEYIRLHTRWCIVVNFLADKKLRKLGPDLLRCLIGCLISPPIDEKFAMYVMDNYYDNDYYGLNPFKQV